MDSSSEKALASKIHDLTHYYFGRDRPELSFDDKPFTNLLEVLYPIVRTYDYFGDDLFISTVLWYIENLDSIPQDMDKQPQILLDNIKDGFIINKGLHYLVFPLQGSKLKSDISFSNFHMLSEKKEDEMMTQISNITHIKQETVVESLEHTKKSRSRDFLQSNIMIIRVEDQTENVQQTAYSCAQCAVDSMLLIYLAFGMQSSPFVTIGEMWEKKNRHVAILSEDGWRRGHGHSWDANLQCKIDLSFMADTKFQSIFCNLYNTFALKESCDELSYLFLNAFMLFSRAYIQKNVNKDDALSLLLYITALESLITDNQYEKKLRLCVIIPRIIKINGLNQPEMSRLLRELYMKRNSFVHAGKNPRFDYHDTQLDTLERMVAVLLLEYFEIDKKLKLAADQTRLSAWRNYLDEVFNTAIYG